MKGKLFHRAGYKLENKKADALLETFRTHFMAEVCEQNSLHEKRSRLIWCNLLPGCHTIPTENVPRLPVAPNQKVYYYGERDNEMYATTFSEVCAFLRELEPWGEIDSEIFDDTFTWYIAITHEDISLVYGLETRAELNGLWLIEKLKTDPEFRKAGRGYQLLEAYFDGLSTETLHDLLRCEDKYIKGLALWIISELARAVPRDFLEEAASLMSEEDPVIYFHSSEIIAWYGRHKYMDDFMRIFMFFEHPDAKIRRMSMYRISQLSDSRLKEAYAYSVSNKILGDSHEKGLVSLMHINTLTASDIRTMLNSGDSIIRKYGAIAVLKVYKKYPELIREFVNSEDADVREYIKPKLAVEAESALRRAQWRNRRLKRRQKAGPEKASPIKISHEEGRRENASCENTNHEQAHRENASYENTNHEDTNPENESPEKSGGVQPAQESPSILTINDKMKKKISNNVPQSLDNKTKAFLHKIVNNTKILKDCVIYDEYGIEDMIDWNSILEIVGDATGYEIGCNEFRLEKDEVGAGQYQMLAYELHAILKDKYPDRKFVIYLSVNGGYPEIRFHTYRTGDGFWLEEDLNVYITPILCLHDIGTDQAGNI